MFNFFDVRNFLLCGLTLTTFCLSALPWFIIDIKGLPITVHLFFIFCAAIHQSNQKIAYNSNINLDDTYLGMMFILLTALLSFCIFTKSQEYGFLKSELFFIKVFAPLIAFKLLSPLQDDDFKIIVRTIIFSALIVAALMFFNGDIYNSRTTIDEGTGELSTARNLGMGLCLVVSLYLYKVKYNFFDHMQRISDD